MNCILQTMTVPQPEIIPDSLTNRQGDVSEKDDCEVEVQVVLYLYCIIVPNLCKFPLQHISKSFLGVPGVKVIIKRLY